jgi:hypothetical protein
VPIGPITRARAKKFKEAFNGHIWSKMDLEGLGHLRSMKDNL